MGGGSDAECYLELVSFVVMNGYSDDGVGFRRPFQQGHLEPTLQYTHTRIQNRPFAYLGIAKAQQQAVAPFLSSRRTRLYHTHCRNGAV